MDGLKCSLNSRPVDVRGTDVQHAISSEQAHKGTAEFLPFKEALPYASTLMLDTEQEWQTWGNSGARPAHVPSAPAAVYTHDGWQRWGHWLGTGAVANTDKQFLPFNEALRMTSTAEQAHEGTAEFLPFKEALSHARALMLDTEQDWQTWGNSGARPAYIPSAPDAVYTHDGWQGWGHWCGTGAVATQDQQFLPFKKALLHARSLKLKTVREWKEWCKSGTRPANMTSDPGKVYTHEGWQGHGHWLGTGNVGVKKDQEFLPFKEALLYAHSLKLKTRKEWMEWSKSGSRPANMPSNPHTFYKADGWQGYGHWLGAGSLVEGELDFLPNLAPKKGRCARPRHALPTSPSTRKQPTGTTGGNDTGTGRVPAQLLI